MIKVKKIRGIYSFTKNIVTNIISHNLSILIQIVCSYYYFSFLLFYLCFRIFTKFEHINLWQLVNQRLSSIFVIKKK